MAEKIFIWIAWRLPKTLVMWCGFRIAAHATAGKFGHEAPDDVSVMDAMKRWEDPN